MIQNLQKLPLVKLRNFYQELRNYFQILEIINLLEHILQKIPAEKLAGHFHDTQGVAIDNIKVALEYGLRTFDSSVGGLGGCPYAPGASGNVATEKLVSFLKKYGYQTKVDEEQINFVASFVKNLLKNKQII